MNKTISITLAGLIFNVTEEAYQLLFSYLEKLKVNLKGQDSAEEIREDIENRIAELCTEIMEKEHRNVIYASDIEKIIAQMGNPDDFIDPSEKEKQDTHETQSETKEGTTKKLFRDGEEGLIGGVCAGIAAYFNIDSIIVRVIFLIAFFGFGTGLLIYIILWIILPEAVTASDRLRMKGENINLKNIQSTIYDKVNEINSKQSRKKIYNFFSEIITPIVRWILPLIGIFLLIIGVLGIIGLLIAFFSDYSIFSFDGAEGQMIAVASLLPHFYTNSFDTSLTTITIVAASIIPLIIITILGIQLIIQKKSKSLRYIYMSLFGFWLLSIIGIAYSSVKGIGFFSVAGQNTEWESYTMKSDTLNINCLTSYTKKDIAKYIVEAKEDENKGELTVYQKNGRIYINKPHLQIKATDDSLLKIETILKSHGRTLNIATKNAKAIHYSMLKAGNNLTVGGDYSYPSTDKFRNQHVTVNLYIPNGTVIYFNRDLKNIFISSFDDDNEWSKMEDFLGHYWKMENGELHCKDCKNFHND